MLHLWSGAAPLAKGDGPEDTVVPVSNSDLYAEALRAVQVDCGYVRGPFGEHGGSVTDIWSRQCLAWLRRHGFGE